MMHGDFSNNELTDRRWIADSYPDHSDFMGSLLTNQISIEQNFCNRIRNFHFGTSRHALSFKPSIQKFQNVATIKISSESSDSPVNTKIKFISL